MLLAQATHLPHQDHPPEQRSWLLERQKGQQVHTLQAWLLPMHLKGLLAKLMDAGMVAAQVACCRWRTAHLFKQRVHPPMVASAQHSKPLLEQQAAV